VVVVVVWHQVKWNNVEKGKKIRSDNNVEKGKKIRFYNNYSLRHVTRVN
jgi:hypothetical protein